MIKPSALAVASDDAAGFPEGEVVEELAAGDSYLANEQLIEVVGGQAFFRRPFLTGEPSDAGLSLGSPEGMR